MIVIEINAIRRSGHHAFINWLISNIHEVKYQENLCKWKFNTIQGNKNILWVNEGEQFKDIILNHIDNNPKPDVLIISYESPTKSTLSKPNYSLLTDNLRLKWDVTEHIQFSLVRDFYNNFASLSTKEDLSYFFSNEERHAPNSMLMRYIYLYKMQLKQTLNTFKGVIYDKWVSDEVYANEVCLKLIGKPNKYRPIEIGGTHSSYNEEQLQVDSLLKRYQKTKWPKWLIDRISSDNELVELIEQAGFNKHDLEIQEN